MRLEIGRWQDVMGLSRLVGPMGAPETLNGPCRLPAGLENVVDPLPRIYGRVVGMEAVACSSGAGKHENALLVGLEEIGICARRIPTAPLFHDS